MSKYERTVARIGALDEAAMTSAGMRQDNLTKPRGSLGRLEELSILLAGICGQHLPKIERKAIITMAADHGIARRGVSAYPVEVTPQMVLNFLNGGAAINVLARHVGARVVVVDIGVAAALGPHPNLVERKIAYGTADLSIGPAMSREQAIQALEIGIEVVEGEIDKGLDIVGTGDMGIGNTTASSAIVAAITGAAASAVTGRGTGVDDGGLLRKITAVEQALSVNCPDPSDAIDVLAKVGGFEIGGLAGVMLGAAAKRIPVAIDGFISGAAALIANGLCPSLRPYLIAAHLSVEAGHAVALEHLGLHPFLDLQMRLGEGTGAALGISVAEAAVRILREMATFEEAGVSSS